ncbi:Protein serine/threonine kinase [Entamoeba marina]
MFFLWLSFFCFASVVADYCVCVPLGFSCLDGFHNTCNSSFTCDALFITTDYVLLDECTFAYNTYLEIQPNKSLINIFIEENISSSLIGGSIHDQSYVNLIGSYLIEIQPKLAIELDSYTNNYMFIYKNNYNEEAVGLLDQYSVNFQSKTKFINGGSINFANKDELKLGSTNTTEITLNYTELSTNQNEPILIDAIAIQFIGVDGKIYVEEQNNTFYFVYNSFSLSLQFLQTNFVLFNSFGFVWDNVYCDFIIVNNTVIECVESFINNNCQEDLYYDFEIGECMPCGEFCQRCLSTTECILCSDGYYLNNGSCVEKSSNCMFMTNGVCKKCSDGYYVSNGLCVGCDNGCISCNETFCFICNSSVNINGDCITDQHGVEIMTNNGIISCENGMFNNNEMFCVYCNETFPNCGLCDKKKCCECEDGYQLTNEFQCVSNYCSDDNCEECLVGYQKDVNGKCIEASSVCLTFLNGECIKCIEGLILYNGGCVTNISHCTITTTTGCLRCSDGYYLNEEMQCSNCSTNCLTCLNTEDTCTSCDFLEMLTPSNECSGIESFLPHCIKLNKILITCEECDEGYYVVNRMCSECQSGCDVCSSIEYCLTCNYDYYLTKTKNCALKSTIIGCDGNITENGCSSCSDGYFSNDNACELCNETCQTCSSNNDCTSCIDGYVLKFDKCVYFRKIDYCLSAKNSVCESCGFWHTTSEDKTLCVVSVDAWLVSVVAIISITILCVVAPFTYFICFMREERRQKKGTKTICSHFSHEIQQCQDCINFSNDEGDATQNQIDINKESRDLKKIRVQLSVKNVSDKYEIRTTQYAVTLNKGMACEFEIFIKPLCTCKIEDHIVLLIKTLHNNIDALLQLKINTQTKMSTHLDYDELTEDIKLGEGSFGIVYKGMFRGNQVAIKKMKTVMNTDKQLKEFNKEVTMLGNIRSEYIVHFYGAVFIPHKICMVTEFAQHCSLKDLMNKTKDDPIDNTMKLKMLLDCSKGIAYLHSNGILHRDIKPDNLLVMSLDTNIQVNAKLTDFGSSRNINMLMTNMTFTKCVGTPIYMAPEILNKKKYTQLADIYSFAVTVYETYKWEDPYGSLFEYPWELAAFISSGKRLPQPDSMCDSIYSLIDDCWKQEPSDRIGIEEIIERITLLRSNNDVETTTQLPLPLQQENTVEV